MKIKRCKIVKIVGVCFAILLISTVSAGCAQLPQPEETATSTQDELYLNAAIRQGEALLNAFKKNNYADVKDALPESLHEYFTQENFDQTLEQLSGTLGKIVSFQYLTELQTPLLKTLVWKIQLQRPASDGSTIEQEVLFRALIAPVDGKPSIFSFGFL